MYYILHTHKISMTRVSGIIIKTRSNIYILHTNKHKSSNFIKSIAALCCDFLLLEVQFIANMRLITLHITAPYHHYISKSFDEMQTTNSCSWSFLFFLSDRIAHLNAYSKNSKLQYDHNSTIRIPTILLQRTSQVG